MTTVTTTTSVPPIQPASSSTTKPDSGVAPKAVAATTTKVDVDRISTSGSSVITITATAQQTAASSAVFSSKKVEEIKLAIAEGRFEMNSERIAEALIREATELVHPRR